MTSRPLNLASRPFSNSTPVIRTITLLAAIAALLVTLNVVFYWGYFSGSSEEARVELADLESRIAELRREARDLDAELARYDLDEMNREVSFLNLKIAERVFGWSQLFDDLAEVLPPDVRLERLQPAFARRSGPGGEVSLTIVGRAREEGAFLEFVDALFAHPRFDDPDPSREALRDGETQFNLEVMYLPSVEVPGKSPVDLEEELPESPEEEELLEAAPEEMET